MNSLSNRRTSRGLIVPGALAGMLVAMGPVASTAAAADAPSTALQAGPISLQFGGFTALETAYRNKNEVADIGSDFNTGIPFDYQTNAHQSEFRESARQSRLSLLAQGPEADGMRASGYFEMDFLSAGVTSNSRESNSYTMRVRHIYGLLSGKDAGWYVLAGQTWSLATLYGPQLSPTSGTTPLTIDAQYVAGFNWTRNPQIRIVKKFTDTATVGVSIESPQAVIYTGCSGPSFCGSAPALVNNNGAGSGLNNSTTTYSTDFAPDIIAKFALDPGWGHYELYGLGRGFRDRYPGTASGTNDQAWGASVGAGAVLPLIGPKLLQLQLSGLYGNGIGRYGSAQLPDYTLRPDGSIAIIRAAQGLAGLILRPNPAWTYYLYYGIEQAQRTAFADSTGKVGFGYGSPLYDNSGCDSLTGKSSSCIANTRSIQQLAAGAWWKAYQGSIGNVQVGLQYSYTDRTVFSGVGGAPSANISMAFLSLRYYPYQR